MAVRADITPELCRQLLRYESETGRLFWQTRPREMFETDRHFKSWNTRYSGSEAFTAINAVGYRHGQLFGVHFAAHQMAWIITHGAQHHLIDHINGDVLDNRISNLRSATPTQNSTNQKLNCRNTSGYKGVRWSTEKRKWQALINADRKFRHLGYFENAEDAAHAYADAAAIYHGDFVRTG